MKKMCGLVSLIFVIAMAFCVNSVLASEERVEITFCVGDETLMINGMHVTVECPYVVGEGVTLVPLRVITEAFGATVDWEDATRTITLTYPDVSIVLQIDNPIAEVNGRKETLLAAPELPTSYTMVPLRFISETFGANVSYDDNTQKITVVKENSQNDSALTGAIDSTKIGDSYYKWSMENPIDMQMDTREFDGTYTSFEGEYGYFYILIISTPEDYDFEKDFVNSKASLQGSTLVKADKNTNEPNKKTMHFQAKNQDSFLNVRYIVTDQYIYVVHGVFDNEATDKKDEAVRFMDTFDLNFSGSDIYDLSNVKDNMRKFENEKLKISFNVPEDYYQVNYADAINKFQFASMKKNDNISTISLGVYSKSETGDAQTLAKWDYDHNKSSVNETISSFSEEIRERSYNSFSAFEYDYTLDYTAGKEYVRDVFFEKGEYTYNINVQVKMPISNADDYIDSIINSVTIETIDPDKVGVLLRNFPEATGTFVATMDDATLELPNIYQAENKNPSSFYNLQNDILIILQKISNENKCTFNDVFDTVRRIEKDAANQSKNKIIANTESKTIGNFKFATCTIKTVEDEDAAYIQYYGMCRNNSMYGLTIVYPEIAYSENARQEVLDIIKTLNFK